MERSKCQPALAERLVCLSLLGRLISLWRYRDGRPTSRTCWRWGRSRLTVLYRDRWALSIYQKDGVRWKAS
jgi:hypothetical protein